VIQDYYTQNVAIMRRSTAAAAWGTEPSWSTSTSVAPVKMAVTITHGAERYAQDKDTVFADYKFYCSSTVDIDEHDRLKWLTNIFAVVERPKNTLQKSHHKKILARFV
jgi:head-tail adaptor